MNADVFTTTPTADGIFCGRRPNLQVMSSSLASPLARLAVFGMWSMLPAMSLDWEREHLRIECHWLRAWRPIAVHQLTNSLLFGKEKRKRNKIMLWWICWRVVKSSRRLTFANNLELHSIHHHWAEAVDAAAVLLLRVRWRWSMTTMVVTIDARRLRGAASMIFRWIIAAQLRWGHVRIVVVLNEMVIVVVDGRTLSYAQIHVRADEASFRWRRMVVVDVIVIVLALDWHAMMLLLLLLRWWGWNGRWRFALQV